MDGIAAMTRGLTRRSVLCAALPTIALGPLAARGADSRVPIADMHSHFAIITRPTLSSSDFAEELRAQRVALIAWSLPSDFRWIRASAAGLEQARGPAAGELSAFFHERLARMKAYVERSGLRPVLARADVDACLAGDVGVVLASEGADFLEGRVAGLGCLPRARPASRAVRALHQEPDRRPPDRAAGPRRPERRRQTAGGSVQRAGHPDRPGALQLACRRACARHRKEAGSLVAQLGRPHGGPVAGRHRPSAAPPLARAGEEDPDRGGVIGLWGLGLEKPGPSRTPGQGNWTVSRGDTRGYAREIAHLVNWLGADHVHRHRRGRHELVGQQLRSGAQRRRRAAGPEAAGADD